MTGFLQLKPVYNLFLVNIYNYWRAQKPTNISCCSMPSADGGEKTVRLSCYKYFSCPKMSTHIRGSECLVILLKKYDTTVAKMHETRNKQNGQTKLQC